MESTDILSLLELLDDEIDDLEDALVPVLTGALFDTASKLPLLDKAKLYILITYALESILFSYLRLNGVKAREHPVFQELTRIKQYFAKIATAEAPVEKRETSVDKKAAARFIRAGLSGNDNYDLKKAERQAKEKARANSKFNNLTERTAVFPAPLKAASDDESSSAGNQSSSDSESVESAVRVPTDNAISASDAKKRKLESSSVSSSGLQKTGDSDGNEGKDKRRKFDISRPKKGHQRQV